MRARAPSGRRGRLHIPALTDKNCRFTGHGLRCARMKFNLIDQIESISDSRIVATKHVSLAE